MEIKMPRALLPIAIVWTLLTCAHSARSAPVIGYLYPAGAQRGSTVRVTVGGQNLQGAVGAVVSGGGATVKFLDYARPLRQGQLNDVRQHLREQLKQRYAAARGVKKTPENPAEKVELPPLPEHPWLRDLDKKTAPELEELQAQLFNPKRPPNSQIGEWVLLEIALDAEAPPGPRELRLVTKSELSNPLRFAVGVLPEVLENDPLYGAPPEMAPYELPVVLNGQILPGDVDRFNFKARRGQNIVVRAHARRLIPYLADAVPGWFQAVLALYDDKGREVAYNDDNEFDPDPLLHYVVPESGVYQLQINDAIFRGREDFVYRISVGEVPFVTAVFPLGARSNAKTSLQLPGWNLPAPQVTFTAEDAARTPLGILENIIEGDGLRYAIDALPEITETEGKVEANGAAAVQRLALPQIVNGRISFEGDTDRFFFQARGGDEIVAEVMARRLNSPLDSLLRLCDSSGKVLAFNDDVPDKSQGLLTHQADSYLRAKIPAAGLYRIEISDVQNRGGANFAYRLRVGAPQPDFALNITPSSFSIEAGRVAVLTAIAHRKDGFAGDIELALDGAPEGFVLSGARIPAGRDRVRFTVTAPAARRAAPLALRIVGRANIGGATLQRAAVPADEMMQAFIYWHQVPAQELLLLMVPPRVPAPAGVVSGELPVKIAPGGSASVVIKTGQKPTLTGVEFQLNNAPKGIALGPVAALPDGLEFTLKADGAAPVNYADNLIIEVYAVAGGRRSLLGWVPAVPLQIIHQITKP